MCLLLSRVLDYTYCPAGVKGWEVTPLAEKMAIILPIGQWYAPSAVINYAWYCMVLHGIGLYCIVLHGIAW